jgi:hypothetical protein
MADSDSRVAEWAEFVGEDVPESVSRGDRSSHPQVEQSHN